MDRPLTWVSGATARALIARVWLAPDSAATLGSITLRPHQRDAIARARAALNDHGGTLIADDVGLGKTFIALALAAEAHRPLVVGPASLRAMWARACEQAGVTADYRSYEALSRAPMPSERYDLVVLDEAHHARTPRTARYRHLASALAGARVVLLTATPIHNAPRDLRALLALFLGSLAWGLGESELAAYIIRREREDVALDAPLPALAPPQSIAITDDAAVLEALIALPPPVPPRDGGDGGALLSFTLARLWASSHFALRAALRRRLHRARALEDALSCGRHPTRAELRAWTLGEDATQLAFPELMASSGSGDVSELLSAVRAHAAAIEELVHTLPGDSPRDRERAERVREITSRHTGEKVIAFTQFGDTAAGLFRLLRDTVRSCQLDGRGARVSGGRLSRREALARFAPRASGAMEPHAAERIDLLIATDLLSEGVNLQDASVVVHLDLPWTSARMAQRVGRSRRLGAMHSATSVYAFVPPAAADALLRQEQRLREKLHAAARLTGACGAILPVGLTLAPSMPMDEPRAPARALELLRIAMAPWRAAAPTPAMDGMLPVASVRADQCGALALVRHEDGHSLVTLAGMRVSDRPDEVLDAAHFADGADAEADDDRAATTITRLESWLSTRAGAAVAGIGRTIAGMARRVAMRRIAHIAARTPLHHRGQVAPLAAEARRIVTAPYGVGAERILAELADAPLADEAWLRAVRAFGEANCRAAGGPGHGVARPSAIEALILFGP
jgi:superfamily II DNA or RNA helicase